VFLFTLGVRWFMAWVIGVHWIKDSILRKNFWLLPVRDLISFLIWLLSLQGRIVEWRGTRFKLVTDGKIVEIKG
jgi:ceramide glucosyltransferase